MQSLTAVDLTMEARSGDNAGRFSDNKHYDAYQAALRQRQPEDQMAWGPYSPTNPRIFSSHITTTARGFQPAPTITTSSYSFPLPAAFGNAPSITSDNKQAPSRQERYASRQDLQAAEQLLGLHGGACDRVPNMQHINQVQNMQERLHSLENALDNRCAEIENNKRQIFSI